VFVALKFIWTRLKGAELLVTGFRQRCTTRVSSCVTNKCRTRLAILFKGENALAYFVLTSKKGYGIGILGLSLSNISVSTRACQYNFDLSNDEQKDSIDTVGC
jgi:hypothetical protein